MMENNNYIQTCIEYLNKGAIDACLKELVASTSSPHYIHESASRLLLRLNALHQDFYSGQIAYSVYEQHRNQIASGTRQLLCKPSLSIRRKLQVITWPIGVGAFLLTISLILWFVAWENAKFGSYYYELPQVSETDQEVKGKNLLCVERKYYLDIGDTASTIRLKYQLPDKLTGSYQLVSGEKGRMAVEIVPQNGTLGEKAYRTLEEIEGKYFEMKADIPCSGMYIVRAYFSSYPTEKDAEQLAKYFSLGFVHLEQGGTSSAAKVFNWPQFIAYHLGERNLRLVTLIFAGMFLTIILFSTLKR